MTGRHPLLPLCAAMLAAACQATSPGVPTSTTSGAPAAAPAAATIHGTATYVERIKMPPGASLRVDVLDAATGARLEGVRVQDVAGPPIPFDVPRPPSAAGGLALRGTLVGADGEAWFETAAPVVVPPGNAAVELRMRRVEAVASSSAPPAPGPLAHWECNELGVMSRFDTVARRVRLDYNGHALTLPIARSASGARYADPRGNEFWTKGGKRTLSLVGEPSRDCVQASQPSPWNDAVLGGSRFRAVGNEPGWATAIAGSPPVADLQLDYGERHLRVAVTPTPDGFAGRDANTAVRLRVERMPCEDGMSGQRFEAKVTLDVDGHLYRGCGAYLDD